MITSLDEFTPPFALDDEMSANPTMEENKDHAREAFLAMNAPPRPCPTTAVAPQDPSPSEFSKGFPYSLLKREKKRGKRKCRKCLEDVPNYKDVEFATLQCRDGLWSRKGVWEMLFCS